MFNNFVALLKGFFSNSFWFGSFLPVAIVAGIHYALCLWYRGKLDTLGAFLKLNMADTWQTFLTIAVLIVIAYIVSPLIPLFRGVLDASLLPQPIHDMLRRDHLARVFAIRAKLAAATVQMFDWATRAKRLEEALWEPRARGMTLHNASDPRSVEAAERLVAPLAREMESGRLPEGAKVEAAAEALATALRTNAPNLQAPHADHDVSRRLEVTHTTMVRVLKDAAREARQHFLVLSARYDGVAMDAPQATRVADARSLAERYPLRVYGADFEFLWPRLQLQMETGRIQDRLVAAQAQQDFAVLSLALLITVPLVWLPTFALSGDSPWPFIAIGVASPLLLSLFYELVVQTQRAYGEVIKGMVDCNRIDVLTKTLRQPVPASLSAERELWGRVCRAEEKGDKADFPYRQTAI